MSPVLTFVMVTAIETSTDSSVRRGLQHSTKHVSILPRLKRGD